MTALGLPLTYPVAHDGITIPLAECQPIDQRSFDADERGIACRSAAPNASGGERVVWFAHPGTSTPKISAKQAFDDWFWR